MIVFDRTAHSGPSTALAKGSACTPRTCHSAHRGVRPIGGTISRRFETVSCSCAATLILGRGQQLRTDGARHRASARFDAHQAFLPETPVLDLPTCSRLFWGNLQMSFVTTHTSMIDVADLSMFSPSPDTIKGRDTSRHVGHIIRMATTRFREGFFTCASRLAHETVRVATFRLKLVRDRAT